MASELEVIRIQTMTDLSTADPTDQPDQLDQILLGLGVRAGQMVRGRNVDGSNV